VLIRSPLPTKKKPSYGMPIARRTFEGRGDVFVLEVFRDVEGRAIKYARVMMAIKP